MYFAYQYVKKKRQARTRREATTTAAAPGPDVVPAGGPSPPVGHDAVLAEARLDAPVSAEEGKEPNQVEKEPEDPVAKKKRRVRRLKILLGLFFPFTLQALDMTIVASALPFIAADFHQVSQLNWIISAFNLTTAAFLPFWAQIADIFGRHVTLQSTIVLVMVGSAICTGAPTRAFGVLLLGRALQGVGAAGINICVRTILADGVSLRDYTINWTLFSLVAAVSFSIGPVIGGYLTQTSWRWVFAINLPVAAAAVVLVLLLLRKELLGPQPLPELGEAPDRYDDDGGVPVPRRPHRLRDASTRRGRFFLRIATVDYGGQLLFLWGVGLLILALTWAGGTYRWDAPAVLAPLVLGAALSAAWVAYEYLMAPGKALARALPHQRAMLPWELISRRDIGLLFLINFAVGMAMFAVLYFMDLYFALVKGNSPGKAGVALLYYLPGLGVGGYMAMFTTNVWPRQTLPPLLLGAVTSAVGITVLAYAIDRENTPLLYGMMALTGHGVGLRMNPGSLHGLAYFPKLTAQVSFLVSFAMPFGGTVALTLMSTVFNNKSGGAAKTSGEGGGGMSSSSSDDAPVPTGDAHVVVRDAIRWAFIAIVPFMWLCVLLTTFLGNVWVGKDGTHDVVNGVYLWNLARGKKLERERRTRGDRAEAAEAAAAAAAATAAAEKDDVEKNKSADTKGAATV